MTQRNDLIKTRKNLVFPVAVWKKVDMRDILLLLPLLFTTFHVILRKNSQKQSGTWNSAQENLSKKTAS